MKLKLLARLFVRQILERSKTPFLLLLLVGFWFSLAGLIGGLNSIGFTYLFWHADPLQYYLAAVAVGFFLADWFWVGYMLDTPKDWFQQIRSQLSHAHVSCYLAFSGTALGAVFSLAAYCYAHRVSLPAAAGTLPAILGTFLLMTAGGGLVALLRFAIDRRIVMGTRFGSWLRMRIAATFPRAGQSARIQAVRLVYFVLLALILLSAATIHWLVEFRFLTPALYFCILLIFVVGLYGGILFYRQAGLLWFAILTATLICGYVLLMVWNRHYPIRDLTTEGAVAGQLNELLEKSAAAAGESRAAEQADLQTWRGRFNAGGTEAAPRPKLVVVATTGGGIKAQVWTTVVLSALEREIEGFPYHVRLITGASGGMVGASYYVATLTAPENGRARHQDGAGQRLSCETMIQQMSGDALTPVVHTFFYNDLIGLGLPRLDRGMALERAWEKFTASRDDESPLARQLSSLAETEQAGWRPSLVYTPTLADDGRRLLISNHDLRYLTHAEVSRSGTASQVYSISALDWRSAFAGSGLRISTAARLSANFPLVVASPTVPVTPSRRVMDAGYYDNFGGYLAARWLYENREALDALDLSGILFLQIGVSSPDRKSGASPPTSLPEVAGFFNTSFSKSIYMADEQLQLVDRYFNHRAAPPAGLRDDDEATSAEVGHAFFTAVRLEYGGPASLSWYLSPAEIYSLLYPFLQGDPESVDQQAPHVPFSLDDFPDDFRPLLTSGKQLFDQRIEQFSHQPELRRIQATRKITQQTVSELIDWWKKP